MVKIRHEYDANFKVKVPTQKRLRLKPKVPRPAKHGRSHYTNHGCRCDVCVLAQRVYQKSYMREYRENQT